VGFTVAIRILLLVHDPPDIACMNVVVEATHTNAEPMILLVSVGFTVTSVMLEQPPPMVYVIAAVPGVTPVTRPTVFTVATDVVPLLHKPPNVAAVRIVVLPMQKLVVPVVVQSVGTVESANLAINRSYAAPDVVVLKAPGVAIPVVLSVAPYK
jgi:hypothetical protein